MTATATGGWAAPERRSIRVLMALTPPDGSTRYVDQITAGAPPEVSITYRTWRSAFTGRYDVFHVHWPEFLVRAKNPLTSVGRGVLLLLLLARLKVGRVAIVRTLHNLAAHEDLESRWQRWLLAVLHGQTTLFIRINPATELDTDAPVVTIPHGHYRDRFAAMDKRDPPPKRLLYFGLIRGYKGIDGVLDLVAAGADPELTLRIVGKPMSDAVVAQIRRAAEQDRRITARLQFVPDEDLVAEVTAAQVVVLPYREMHNSGAVLVALSLDRPVVVPRTAVNEALDDEVGPGWVFMYDGVLTAEVVDLALAASALRGRRPPDLRDRDWAAVGEGHYQAYLRAVSIARPRKREQLPAQGGQR
jgi:beta-1,4-mannosyltransferase